ncbi:copper-binding protein [Pusillimonas sp. CC-YST705]|uniref:Copper-binding protein n=1 Tax=Mesopusillimonas faecipullorum TaxID=2755040 RepID=A0ABS8CF36_9BURK|nr:copper-binding protein [Mesopusillimonas faecipullorum]MCB5364645.1 copper-binding protein [Mesopusillimonas faecipullorum]
MAFTIPSSCRLAALALTVAAISSPAFAQQAESSGEVRRVDTVQGKIVIKHNAIPDLKLPAMSLAYHVQPILIIEIKPGDKVTFTAQRENDRYVIVKISK